MVGYSPDPNRVGGGRHGFLFKYLQYHLQGPHAVRATGTGQVVSPEDVRPSDPVVGENEREQLMII